jgi:hypothetical protein
MEFTREELDALLYAAFQLGFANSQEGFNGETDQGIESDTREVLQARYAAAKSHLWDELDANDS